MKATTLFATLLLPLVGPSVLAQAEEAGCASCAAQKLKIEQLEAQLLALQTPAVPETAEASIPDAATEPVIAPPVEPEVAASDATYTVAAGDSFLRVARKQGCKASDLAAVNGMTLESVIHPGQTLKLPTGTAVAATPPQPKTYTIQEGDTYYSLSRRLNIPLDQLMAANPKAKATALYNGRVINLPTTAAETPSTAVNTPTEEPVPAPKPTKKIRSVMIEGLITYEEFAAQHGTSTERLNELNGLDIAGTTVLAKGSELYVPAQQ